MELLHHLLCHISSDANARSSWNEAALRHPKASTAAVGLLPGVLQCPSDPTTDQSMGGSSAKSNKAPGMTDVGSSGKATQTTMNLPRRSPTKGLAGPVASLRSPAVGAHHCYHNPAETKTLSISRSQAQPKVEAMETMDLDSSYTDADIDSEVAFSRGPP